MKNIEVKDIPKLLAKAGGLLKRHAVFIVLILVFCTYGFLIFEINKFTSVEPSQEKIDEQLNRINRPKIDQAAIDKIEQLEDQNVGVQSLFKSARDNPFQDN